MSDKTEIDKELKNRYPDKKIPSWMKNYIYGYVYEQKTLKQLSQELNLSRTTIYNYVDEDIKKYIDELKDLLFDQYEHKVYTLIDSSLETLEQLVRSADSDATRLKAIELVLKKYGIFTDTQKVEIDINKLPILEIVTSHEDLHTPEA